MKFVKGSFDSIIHRFSFAAVYFACHCSLFAVHYCFAYALLYYHITFCISL